MEKITLENLETWDHRVVIGEIDSFLSSFDVYALYHGMDGERAEHLVTCVIRNKGCRDVRLYPKKWKVWQMEWFYEDLIELREIVRTIWNELIEKMLELWGYDCWDRLK